MPLVRATNQHGTVLEISREEWQSLSANKKAMYKPVPHGYYVHMNEEAEAHAIIGGNKQGKSSLVAEIIKQSYSPKFHKVVVLNASAPIAFNKYKFIDNPDMLKRDWRGVVRYHSEGGYKKILKDIYELVTGGYIRNGAIVFDDCTKYIDPWPSEEIRAFMVDRRMYGLDLIFTTHALSFYPKFCRKVSNTITVFKTAEAYKSENEIRSLGYANSEGLFKAWQAAINAPVSKQYIQPHFTIETGI